MWPSWLTDSRVVYYLLLYAFVVVLRLFKVSRGRKTEPDRYSWKHIAYLGLDIVYTSAGLAILLVANQQRWMPAILIGWSVLLLTATLLDTADHLNENVRVAGHLVVVSIVLVATVVSLSIVVPESPPGPPPPSERLFRVAVPYVDSSLDTHIGRGRLGQRVLMYVVEVKAASRRAAEELARKEFWRPDNQAVAPFDGKPKTLYNLSVADAMVVEVLE